MKIPKLPNNVKVHPSAERDIKGIAILDDKKAGKIIQRISELGFDPMPFNVGCTSKVVQNLKKYKINIRRLNCIDINDYRIFYAIRRSGLICIYAVVFAGGDKHDDAYREDSAHYTRIKLLFMKWMECQ
jgi:mRNA-degrading endonuclease RelE of RelBE toxin-antitoxin system